MAALPLALLTACSSHPHDAIGQTRANAATWRFATEIYRAEHPDGPCPSPSALIALGYVSPPMRMTDAWDHPFAIRCASSDVRVVSAGRDGVLGTEDDIATR